MKNILVIVLVFTIVSGCTKKTETEDTWMQLFNGKDLAGWIPKISGYETDVNFNNTFRVEDGILKVSYSEYDSFRREFGHLFYKDEFSHYRLRIEYRFTGEQVPGGPRWAIMNSGVMVHGQRPETMGIDQDFPVSLEAQFLAGTPEWKRSTGNLCTPGTHVYLADTLTKQHCINSTSKTYMLNEWVTAEVIAYGDSLLHHVINGDTVITYTRPVIGDDSYKTANDGAPLKRGTISLQSESHPVEFRKVELMVLRK
ncbi:MAG: DUF1080 domain-containing protein [Cyclobacteriaceae bacterium]|nr:DUF1080 domain-containing protein [Cyclobacteriaceae bacterium]UYN88292.1 MAG: DUF1080 domain-containing protein [Cyclobacteriaceae bacterium]